MIPVAVLPEQVGTVGRLARCPCPQARGGLGEGFRLGPQGLLQDGATLRQRRDLLLPSRSVIHQASLVKRSACSIANWFIASFQWCAALFQSAVILRNANHVGFLPASSLGKCPRVLMILRSRALTLSIALVG